MEEKNKALEFGKGLYITKSQLDVYFGRKRPTPKNLNNGNFNLYCTNCACYNLLSDYMEQFPTEIKFFWNDSKETWGFSFKKGSNVAKFLITLGVLDELEEDICEILL